MEKSDLGEMLGIVITAKEAGFTKVQIDTCDAEFVVNAAYEAFYMKERIAQLEVEKVELVEAIISITDQIGKYKPQIGRGGLMYRKIKELTLTRAIKLLESLS